MPDEIILPQVGQNAKRRKQTFGYQQSAVSGQAEAES
jgi:hypothetical protein